MELKMKVAIWGCGCLLESMLSVLGKEYEIIFLVDSDPEKKNELSFNLPIFSPLEIEEKLADIEGIIICVADTYECRKIINLIGGYKGIYIGIIKKLYEFAENGEIIKWLKIDDKSPCLYIECDVVDGCNLNCKGCSHFAPLCNKTDIYPLNLFEEDIKQLSKYYKPFIFRIMGGEPLLLGNVVRYLEISQKYLNESDIRLVTNGFLLLDQSHDFFELIKKSDIQIDISLYQSTSRIIHKIDSLLKQHNIRYNVSAPIREFNRILNITGNSEPNQSYKNCKQRNCSFFRYGRIYHCPMEILIDKYLNYYGIRKTDIEEMNRGYSVFDETERNAMKDGLCNPCEMCRYCDENGGKTFMWEIGEKTNEEDWISK